MLTILILGGIFIHRIETRCDTGCLRCTPNNTCVLCDTKAGYSMTSNSTDCAIKSIDYCETISQDGRCLRCAHNFYRDSVTNGCLAIPNEIKVPNCAVYDSMMNCISCKNDRFVEAGKCVQVSRVVPNCEIYSRNGICQQCSTNYIFNANYTQCVKIKKIANCLGMSYLKCKKCVDGSLLNEREFRVNTKNISFVGSLIAKTSNQWIVPRTCEEFFDPKCAEVNQSNICVKCKEGYFLNDQNCLQNPEGSIPNCIHYVSESVCKTCQQGHFSLNGVCKKVSPIENCFLYFQGFSNKTICVQCNKEYFLTDEKCSKRQSSNAISNCRLTDPSTDQCKTCREGYQLTNDNLKCLFLTKNCSVFEPSKQDSEKFDCKECMEGFYLRKIGQMTFCERGNIKNCRKYSIEDNKCLVCDPGYLMDNTLCFKHKEIPNCRKYTPSLPSSCLQCKSGYFKFERKNFCFETSQFLPNCIEYSPDDFSCLACSDSHVLLKGECVSVSSIIPNCSVLSNADCVQCSYGYMIDSNSTPKKCIRPFDYVTQFCEQMPKSLSTNFTWSANPSTLLNCDVCQSFSFPIEPSFVEAICVSNDQLVMYQGFMSVPNCKRYGLDVRDGTSLKCMECVDNFFVVRYYSSAIGVPTACSDTCEVNEGKGIVLADDLLGYVGICVLFGTGVGFFTSNVHCGAASRWTTGGNNQNDFLCFSSGVNKIFSFEFSSQNMSFDTFNSDPLTPVVDLHDFWSPFFHHGDFGDPRIRAVNLPKRPVVFNFKGSFVTPVVIPETTEIASVVTHFVSDLSNCEVIVSFQMTDFKGSSYAATGAWSGTFSPVTTPSSTCLKCQFGMFPEYVITAATANSAFPVCRPLKNACFSLIKSGGLPSYLNAVASCHQCQTDDLAQRYPTLHMEYISDQSNPSPGRPIQHAHPVLDPSLSPSFSRPFSCELPPRSVRVPSSDILSAVLSAKCALYGHLYPVQVTDSDPDSSRKLTVCLACRDAHYPKYASSPNTLTGSTLLYPSYTVAECVASLNCDYDSNRSSFNFCAKCVSSVRLNGRDNWTAYADHSLTNCLPSISPNCFLVTGIALYKDRANACGVCRSGFVVNLDGVCEKVVIPNSSVKSSFSLSYFARHWTSLGSSVRSPGDDRKHVIIHYLLSSEGSQYGVSECLKNNALFPRHSLNRSFCVFSHYLLSNHMDFASSSVFVKQCLQYSSSLNSVKCTKCREGFILLDSGDKCVSEIDNCLSAVQNSTITLCSQCSAKFVNLNGFCVTPSIMNCRTYVANQTSINETELKCEDCDVGYYFSSDAKNCIFGNVTNCALYTRETPIKCSKCTIGYFLVSVSQSRQLCNPIPVETDCQEIADQSSWVSNRATFECLRCLLNSTSAFVPIQFDKIEDSRQLSRNICLKFEEVPFCLEYDQEKPTFKENSFKCTSCAPDYWLSVVENVCVKRANEVPNCSLFDEESDSCRECGIGFYLLPHRLKCQGYPTGIGFCLAYKSDDICESCMPGYYLESNSCFESMVVPDCVKYSGNNTCAICRRGFYLSNQTSCIKSAAENCLNYTSKDSCDSCLPNYGLTSNSTNRTCVFKSVGYCVQSTDVYPFECLICQKGFYVGTDKRCHPVLNHVNNCEVYENQTHCKKCQRGSVLSVDQFFCNSTFYSHFMDPLCDDYVLSEQMLCSFCEKNYVLENGTCVLNENVDLKDGCMIRENISTNSCFVCQSGNWMNSNQSCVSTEINTQYFFSRDMVNYFIPSIMMALLI